MRSILIRIIVVLGAFAFAGAVAFAAEQTPPYPGHWPGWYAPWSGFWWLCPLMMLVMIVFFAAVFFSRRGRGDWLPPWRWIGDPTSSRHTHEAYRGALPESALDILNKRYARGEVEKTEYEEKKAAISSMDK